ncbi:inositol monophosphatase family protein [Desertimonas flava]|uniref:inositol monophosphatase family protein n=1 Tax=Desertimonas flava TaxID=2064846 RepID=UPI0013C51380|nr:inositol monophosphatase [Desertimonas flava]
MSVPADPALTVLHRVADEVARRLGTITDWGMSGVRPGQYLADVAVDDVAVEMLLDAGFGVLSEESGRSGPERDRVVVIDPIDGSTNASRGVPWFATALCVVDDAGPAVALVVNQASGQRIEAVRGGGAWIGERRLVASGRRSLDGAVVGVNGRPPADPGWWQFRAFGASALDLALVAGGSLDGFIDFDVEAHGVWDFLASTLICTEAGAHVTDALGRELAVVDHDARRTPVAAATPELLDALVALRQA